ncbi:hypothetical protein PR048_008056 [Dryococelus australis]|uniref:Uncharacterized protein n=1 Tax=Dryococelus australis TaxID=614101 RepID=A0ABQ9HWW9_9NEOP|nr:hypothetical protein PR048_008056 [Dryococelus australis]
MLHRECRLDLTTIRHTRQSSVRPSVIRMCFSPSVESDSQQSVVRQANPSVRQNFMRIRIYGMSSEGSGPTTDGRLTVVSPALYVHFRQTGFNYRTGPLPEFRKWESCRTTPLVGGFAQGSPVAPTLAFQRCYISLATAGGRSVASKQSACDTADKTHRIGRRPFQLTFNFPSWICSNWLLTEGKVWIDRGGGAARHASVPCSARFLQYCSLGTPAQSPYALPHGCITPYTEIDRFSVLTEVTHAQQTPHRSCEQGAEPPYSASVATLSCASLKDNRITLCRLRDALSITPFPVLSLRGADMVEAVETIHHTGFSCARMFCSVAHPEIYFSLTHALNFAQVVKQWMAGKNGAGPECNGGENGRSSRKQADQRHSPARFPLAKIRSDPAGDRIQFVFVRSEQSNRLATAAPLELKRAKDKEGEMRDSHVNPRVKAKTWLGGISPIPRHHIVCHRDPYKGFHTQPVRVHHLVSGHTGRQPRHISWLAARATKRARRKHLLCRDFSPVTKGAVRMHGRKGRGRNDTLALAPPLCPRHAREQLSHAELCAVYHTWLVKHCTSFHYLKKCLYYTDPYPRASAKWRTLNNVKPYVAVCAKIKGDPLALMRVNESMLRPSVNELRRTRHSLRSGPGSSSGPADARLGLPAHGQTHCVARHTGCEAAVSYDRSWFERLQQSRTHRGCLQHTCSLPISPLPVSYVEQYFSLHCRLRLAQSFTLLSLLRVMTMLYLNFNTISMEANHIDIDATNSFPGVPKWLDYSPHTYVNRVRFSTGSLPDFRTGEPCRTMPLVGGFSRGSPVTPTLSLWRCSILISLQPHWLDLEVKSQISSLTHPTCAYAFDLKTIIQLCYWSMCGVIRRLASRLDEPGLIPGGVAPVIFAFGNRAGRCRWSAGFLGDLPEIEELRRKERTRKSRVLREKNPPADICQIPYSRKSGDVRAGHAPPMLRRQTGCIDCCVPKMRFCKTNRKFSLHLLTLIVPAKRRLTQLTRYRMQLQANSQKMYDEILFLSPPFPDPGLVRATYQLCDRTVSHSLRGCRLISCSICSPNTVDSGHRADALSPKLVNDKVSLHFSYLKAISSTTDAVDDTHDLKDRATGKFRCFDLAIGNIACSDAQLDRQHKAEDSQTVDTGKRSLTSRVMTYASLIQRSRQFTGAKMMRRLKLRPPALNVVIDRKCYVYSCQSTKPVLDIASPHVDQPLCPDKESERILVTPHLLVAAVHAIGVKAVSLVPNIYDAKLLGKKARTVRGLRVTWLCAVRFTRGGGDQPTSILPIPRQTERNDMLLYLISQKARNVRGLRVTWLCAVRLTRVGGGGINPPQASKSPGRPVHGYVVSPLHGGRAMIDSRLGWRHSPSFPSRGTIWLKCGNLAQFSAAWDESRDECTTVKVARQRQTSVLGGVVGREGVVLGDGLLCTRALRAIYNFPDCIQSTSARNAEPLVVEVLKSSVVNPPALNSAWDDFEVVNDKNMDDIYIQTLPSETRQAEYTYVQDTAKSTFRAGTFFLVPSLRNLAHLLGPRWTKSLEQGRRTGGWTVRRIITRGLSADLRERAQREVLTLPAASGAAGSRQLVSHQLHTAADYIEELADWFPETTAQEKRKDTRQLLAQTFSVWLETPHITASTSHEVVSINYISKQPAVCGVLSHLVVNLLPTGYAKKGTFGWKQKIRFDASTAARLSVIDVTRNSGTWLVLALSRSSLCNFVNGRVECASSFSLISSLHLQSRRQDRGLPPSPSLDTSLLADSDNCITPPLGEHAARSRREYPLLVNGP